jgi:hypothetical protein
MGQGSARRCGSSDRNQARGSDTRDVDQRLIVHGVGRFTEPWTPISTPDCVTAVNFQFFRTARDDDCIRGEIASYLRRKQCMWGQEELHCYRLSLISNLGKQIMT